LLARDRALLLSRQIWQFLTLARRAAAAAASRAMADAPMADALLPASKGKGKAVEDALANQPWVRSALAHALAPCAQTRSRFV
jgi:hypothetical protein